MKEENKPIRPKVLRHDVQYIEEINYPLISSALNHASDKELEEIVKMIMIKTIKRKNKDNPTTIFHCMASLNMQDNSYHFAVIDVNKDI